MADMELKLVLLGDKNVGKTTLFNQKMYGEPLSTRMTMGAYFTKKEMNIDGKEYDVNVWDTAGEEKFHSLTKIYTRGAHCAIVMYDITLHSSWKAVNTWLSELDEDCVIIIAGNKLDLVQKNVKEREISFDEVRKFAREKKALSMECSAKSGYNVNEMFESVISEYIKRYGISNQDNSQMNNDTNKNSKKSVKLDKGKSPNKKGGCC